MASECSICCENFTSILRKEIICFKCNNHVCKKCVIIWLEERTNITCPCCNHIWTWKFAFDNIDKSFLNKYKEIQKNVLFKIEESLIPQTQEFVINVKEQYNNVKKQYTKLNNMIYKFTNMTSSEIKKEPYIKELNIFENYTKKEIIRYLERERDEIDNRMSNLYEAYKTGILKEEEKSIIKEIKIICPCFEENCKGYIRENNYKCGICELQICNKCHVQIFEDKEHICNKDDINTVKFMNKDSTPCPSCAVRIHKIDGCDQMYCIQCKTAFSYKTGQIEKGRIHNPHYYEELRKIYGQNIPREIEEVVMRDHQEIPDIDPYFVMSKIDDISLSIEFKNYFLFYTQKQEYYFHNVDNVNNYKIDESIQFHTNYEDRVEFIKNKMTKEIFQRKIYKKYKDSKYKNEIYNIIIEYNSQLKEILTEFYKIIYILEDHPAHKNYLELTMKSFIKFRNHMSNYSKLSSKTLSKLDEINNIYNYNGRKIDFYI